VRLERGGAHAANGEPAFSFEFRKLRFVWDPAARAFRRLEYPAKCTYGEYRAAAGHGRPEAVAAARARWGANRFEVPVPRFAALMAEQLQAPFFCFQVFVLSSCFSSFLLSYYILPFLPHTSPPFLFFQVFCVALWALDEYWYYSLFTLFMLVTFESTVVHQRLRNLRDVRALQAPRAPLQVYRAGRWAELPGDDLVPGDLVSLARAPGAGGDALLQADVLLLAGSAIVDEAVLTGESTPQWKAPIGAAAGDAADASEAPDNARLSVKRDRAHVVFGGTKLLQAAADPAARVRTPDGGALALVLRTGFGTAQGRLVRTILYSTERVTANNLETFAFILFLLVWALAASAYVLREGLADPDRDRFKLLLNCVMILTSVVPPELPMELTIAVNASLLALARRRVFCTEPFRIPLAGKVTTCCFDKTGTLTTDRLVLEGVAAAEGSDEGGGAGGALVKDARALPPAAVRVLAGCQSLVAVDGGGVAGDPVERAALEAAGWTARGDAAAGPTSAGREALTLAHRFHFTAALKRMSTVVRAAGGAAGAESWWVLTKGAPEVVAGLLAGGAPPRYAAAYRRHAAEGGRVLALAYKRLPEGTTLSSVRATRRDEAESELVFAGFAVFRAPMKPDSEPSLRMLRASGHQLVMITGDAPLTACHAAAAVHIVVRPPLLLGGDAPDGGAGAKGASAAAGDGAGLGLQWRRPDGAAAEPFDGTHAALAALAADADLCVAGDALALLTARAPAAADALIPLASVFARVTPEQKELVVKTMRAAGLVVLMCGDGTNDVGALKGAHVGVALLPPPEPVPGAPPPPPPPPGPGAAMVRDARAAGRPVTPFMLRMAARMDAMAAAGADGGEAPAVRPGDASMAAPFTAKEASVAPCLDVLRQGRCTLVTTVQMFKILGLLSLSTAYSLSVLYLDGIKLGDAQATLAGVLTAGMFFFISHAQPLPALARARPHPAIFSRYVFSSLLAQFGVHMALLMHLQRGAHAAMADADRQAPDAEFKPNLINTVCFLANFAIQTMTFAVNYVGRPFNTPLAQNKMFAASVRWSAAAYVLLVADLVPGLAGWFSLVELPRALKAEMLGLAGAAFVACTAIERGARAAFPAREPPEKGGLWPARGGAAARLKAA
jgi:cation-transporting ATPase 13A1